MKNSIILLFALWMCALGCSKGVEGSPGVNEVWLEYKLIRPSQLQVAPGTTVKFMNKGNPSHTVQGNLFSSGKIKSGEVYEFTFTTPGTFYFSCGYHSNDPSEQLTIQVQ